MRTELTAPSQWRLQVLCCPLLDANGELVAVLQAINPLHGGSFSPRDQQLLQFMQSAGRASNASRQRLLAQPRLL